MAYYVCFICAKISQIFCLYDSLHTTYIIILFLCKYHFVLWGAHQLELWLSTLVCVCVNSELNVHYWLNLCPGPNLLVMKNLVGQFLLSQLKETQNTKRQSRLCGKKLIYENTKLKKISKLLSMWTWYKIEWGYQNPRLRCSKKRFNLTWGHWYCIETAKPIKLSMLDGIWGFLFSLHQRS